MKFKFLMVFLLAALGAHPVALLAAGDHPVRGHVTKKGKYVAPSRATNPNNTQRDNYSSKPNVNPYSGKQGTREPKK
jgi:hypothetical protein